MEIKPWPNGPAGSRKLNFCRDLRWLAKQTRKYTLVAKKTNILRQTISLANNRCVYRPFINGCQFNAYNKNRSGYVT